MPINPMLSPIQFQGRTFQPSINRSGGERQDFGQVNIPMTTLLVATINASEPMFGEHLIRRIAHRNVLASIRTWLDDHLLQVEANMPPLAKYPTVKARGDRVPVQLDRFAIASELDWHYEAKHLEALRAAGGDTVFEETFATYQLAQLVRDMWMENLRATLLLNPANYLPLNVRTLAPGSEWNSPGGDSRGDIQWAVSRIRPGAPGLNRRRHVVAGVPDSAYDAVLRDPNFFGPNEPHDPPDEETLARKWGIGRTVIGDTATKKLLDGDVESQWKDGVVVKVDHENPPQPIVVPTQTSIYDPIVQLSDSGRGQAMDPKPVQGTTSEYPVAGFDAFPFINQRVIALIENTNKDL